MEAECESEVLVASVAVVDSSEETTLSAETQETASVERSSSESNIETTESQEKSHEVSVSSHEVSVSVESEETSLDSSQSVTTEEEIVRELNSLSSLICVHIIRVSHTIFCHLFHISIHE